MAFRRSKRNEFKTTDAAEECTSYRGDSDSALLCIIPDAESVSKGGYDASDGIKVPLKRQSAPAPRYIAVPVDVATTNVDGMDRHPAAHLVVFPC